MTSHCLRRTSALNCLGQLHTQTFPMEAVLQGLPRAHEAGPSLKTQQKYHLAKCLGISWELHSHSAMSSKTAGRLPAQASKKGAKGGYHEHCSAHATLSKRGISTGLPSMELHSNSHLPSVNVGATQWREQGHPMPGHRDIACPKQERINSLGQQKVPTSMRTQDTEFHSL